MVTPRTERSGPPKRRADQIEAIDTDDEKEGVTKSERVVKKSKGGGKADRDRSSMKGGKGKEGKSAPADEGVVEKPEKKEREKKGLEKMGDQLGSMIGRKRKMRKGGK